MMGNPRPAAPGKHRETVGRQPRRTAEEDEEKNNRLKRENAEEQEALPQFQSARLATISDRR
jgi:hypothetical protein